MPIPILFNSWKHHAAAIRQRIAQVIAIGPAALECLPGELHVIGSELMDLYTGELTLAEIANQVLTELDSNNHRSPEAYRDWLAASDGYRMLTLADSSRWVLRLGAEPERHVHVHPGRWSPHTVRVRANVLKTAILVRAWAGVHRADPCELAVINGVRARLLDLAPIPALPAQGGLRAILALLA